MQYVNTGPPANLTAPYPQGFTCKTDPYWGGAGTPYTGCNVPIQYYDYIQHIERWSNELRLQSKEGGRFHWLGGLYWEKTIDPYSRLLPHAGTADFESGLAVLLQSLRFIDQSAEAR